MSFSVLFVWVVPLFGAVFEDTVGNEPRRREERQEKPEKAFAGSPALACTCAGTSAQVQVSFLRGSNTRSCDCTQHRSPALAQVQACRKHRRHASARRQGDYLCVLRGNNFYAIALRTTSGHFATSRPYCERKAKAMRSRPKATQPVCAGEPSGSVMFKLRPKKS